MRCFLHAFISAECVALCASCSCVPATPPLLSLSLLHDTHIHPRHHWKPCIPSLTSAVIRDHDRHQASHTYHDPLCWDVLSLSPFYLCSFFIALVFMVVHGLRFLAGMRMLRPGWCTPDVEFTGAEALMPSVLDEYMQMRASPAAESAGAAPKASAHHGVLGEDGEGGAAALQGCACCAHVQRGGVSTSLADVGATCVMRLEQLICVDYCKMLCCNADGRRSAAARTLMCLPAPGAGCVTKHACAQACKEGWFDADWRPSMLEEDTAMGKDPVLACCEAAGKAAGIGGGGGSGEEQTSGDVTDAPIAEPPVMSATRAV